MFRPGTADWYDGDIHRGFSRDRLSGWNLKGMGNTPGMDHENAHVDHQGLYRYHAVSPSLASDLKSSLIGYAPDGFEIHYIGANAVLSWRLKSGNRLSEPYGSHDGTYKQDYQYVNGLGNLVECKRTMSQSRYIYFSTDAYPFFPRCFIGTVSQQFLRRP